MNLAGCKVTLVMGYPSLGPAADRPARLPLSSRLCRFRLPRQRLRRFQSMCTLAVQPRSMDERSRWARQQKAVEFTGAAKK